MSTIVRPPICAANLYERYKLLHPPAPANGLGLVRMVKIDGVWRKLIHGE